MAAKRTIRLGKHLEMDIREFLEELGRDRSTWVDVPHYPDSVTQRRMLRLADFAASEPDRWCTTRLAHEHPDWTYEKLAEVLGCSKMTVSRHLEKINLSSPDDYPDEEF